MTRRALLSLAVLVLISTLGFAQLGDLVKRAEGKTEPSSRDTSGLSEGKISAGLKEALEVSTGNAVASTGRHDGFLKNEAIKIALPEKLKAVGKGLRMMGMGGQVDELEVGMNRAAEEAAPAAKSIFIGALKRMSFDDARKILTGGDTAATEYFKRSCSGELTTAFTPVVKKSMANVGVVQKYETVVKNAPGGSAVAGDIDINKYVVSKTLDGLFYVLGQEEQKIRKNPAAQTTSLLKEVFGR
jgi:hypothetical protein